MTDPSAASSGFERRPRQHALLAEIGRRALSGGELDGLFTEAARLCALGLNVRYCKILEYLPETNQLLVRAGVGWQAGVVGQAVIGAELDSPAGYALHTGKPVISNHLADEGRFRSPDLLVEHVVECAINVILCGDGKPFGVLEADSEEPGVFLEYDVDFLQGVANLLGMAIERRRAEEELQRLNEVLEERVATEVAERRQVEDTLRQAQKMEAMGQLTGGVAHDFNNLLLLITGSLDMIANEIVGNPRLERIVATAQKGAMRGAQLTSQLLAFARRQTLRPEIRPINELIAEFDVLAARMLGEAIEINFELARAAGACHVDPAQFGSALLNLIINARDAMPDGGNLTVRTANLVLDARAASRRADARPIAYVFVEVADTGVGMAPEIRDRASEPFFTTKDPGKGTGLGLSQVHGFTQQSGGFLTIESTPGTGTRIRIHVPRVEVEKAAKAESTAAPTKQSKGETILVVEDDADVRTMVIEQLEDLGYRALSAATAQAALDLLAAGSVVIDLVLTDVVMPGGMSGIELLHAIRARWPLLKVVLTSGFMADRPLASGPTDIPDVNGLGCLTLSKPYRLADLARVMEQALRRKVRMD